jgi:hypothetical protein
MNFLFTFAPQKGEGPPKGGGIQGGSGSKRIGFTFAPQRGPLLKQTGDDPPKGAQAKKKDFCLLDSKWEEGPLWGGQKGHV